MGSVQTGTSQSNSGSLVAQIELSIERCKTTNKPFFLLFLQVENLSDYRKKRPVEVVSRLTHELFSAVRTAVHPSQHVFAYQNGLVLVFDGVDTGYIDKIGKRIMQLAQHVIRQGRYNDLSSRWTEILHQFLWPSSPGLLMARVGWTIYPRDGGSANELLIRGMNHVAELAR